MASLQRSDSASGDDVQRFFDHYMKSSGNLTSLSTLFRLAHSHNKPIVPDEVIIALESTLCDKTISSIVYEACIGVLQEILPCDAISYEDLSRELYNKNGGVLLLLLAIQSNDPEHKEGLFKTLLSQLTSNPTSSHENTKLYALRLLSQWISSGETIISDEDVITVAEIIKLGLESFSLSSVKEKSKDKVLEMDGSPASEMYTLLTLPDTITLDYQVNVQTFSVLGQLWPVIIDRNISSVSVNELEVVIFNYCLKIVEQTRRKPIKLEDSAFQQVALIEAINLLAKLALNGNSTYVQELTKVAEELFQSYSIIEIVLPILQLFINLNICNGCDISDKLEKLFDKYLAKAMYNLCSSTEIVLFLKKNLNYLNSLAPSPLRVWFPNIFKILAWHPTTFVDDFNELVPTFMDETTSLEVLHSILDLPCTTLALIYTLENKTLSRKDAHCVEIKMIHLALRKASTTGLQYSDVSNLYKALKPIVNHQRVIASASAIATLLKTYFDVILDHIDEDFALNLLLIILQRSTNLSDCPHQKEFLNKIFAEVALDLFLAFPQLICAARSNILNLFSQIDDPSQYFCIIMIWIVGEYTAPSYIKDIGDETLIIYYDALESLAYENVQNITSSAVSAIIASFVKILMRLPEVTPRVRLFLNKIKPIVEERRHKSEEWRTVLSRVEDATFAIEETSQFQGSFSVDNLIRFVNAVTVELPS